MTQLEFYKSYQFLLELLIAECLFTYRLSRRRFFALRAVAALAACWALFRFFPILSENAFYISFMFLVLFAGTVFAFKFLYKETWLTIVFCCIAGYTVQHMTYELYNLAMTAMNFNSNSPMGFYGSKWSPMFSNPVLLMLYLVLYAAVYFGMYWAFGRQIKRHERLRLKNAFVFVFVVLILVVDILLNAIVVFFLAEEENILYLIIVGIYNVLCCVFALYLQFEVALRRQLQTALAALRQLRSKEREQYETSKENIRLINMRCHDLKHQIRHIGQTAEISSSAVSEIEDLISIYDSTVKTGNDALDVILTEKSLLCNKNGVKLSCIVDGDKLSFMKEEDIYSLFGNIVDNAIEAVLKVPQDKRTISLHVKTVDGMLLVRESNYYADDILFEDGIPLTTKEDKRYHGYGIQSIKYICDRYDGELNISAEGSVFTISLVFCLDDIAAGG